MSDQDLDYRFGWRWLLPLETGDLVLLLGFDEQEIVFWKRALAGVKVAEHRTEATVWVVNDLLPDLIVGKEPSHLQSICVVGSRKTVSAWHGWVANRFAEEREYGMLPPKKPRMVLPLGKGEWMIKGLSLHRPGRWRARCALFTLQLLVRLGIDRPLRAKMVFIANKDHYILPQGAQQGGLHPRNPEDSQAYALYIGTPDEYRKTIILPLDTAPSTVLKQGELNKAKAALRNEAQALKAMNQTVLASRIPLLYDVIESDCCVTLHLEYRPRIGWSDSDIERLSINFLIELSWQGRCRQLLKDVLTDSGMMTYSEAREKGQLAYARVRQQLEELACQEVKVWGHRSHGDFVPWNFAWTVQGFFVFDWEKSQVWDVAFSDVFYSIVGPAVHVTRSPRPALVVGKALALAMDVAEKAELPVEDIRIYWGLWLLQQISQETQPLYEHLLEILAGSWK